MPGGCNVRLDGLAEVVQQVFNLARLLSDGIEGAGFGLVVAGTAEGVRGRHAIGSWTSHLRHCGCGCNVVS